MHLVAESCTICSSRSRRPVQKLLDTSSYLWSKYRTALGPTQPPIQWVPGALFPGCKRPGREAGHSPPSSAEVKECVEIYLHSPIRLHGVVLSYAQGQLFLLPLIKLFRSPLKVSPPVRSWGGRHSLEFMVRQFCLACFLHFLSISFSILLSFNTLRVWSSTTCHVTYSALKLRCWCS
jgi:hypothetical protein